MFENKTYEFIMEEMLNSVPNDVDKREGSIIFDAIAPIAFELSQMYSDLSDLIDETFVDTASYYYLVKKAAERGIIVDEGSPAIVEIVVNPIDYPLEISTDIMIENINFYISQKLEDGHYLATCYENGNEGNILTGNAIPTDYLDGLESIEVYGLFEAGTEEESEESLRERYIESFNVTAFGGNKADYKKKIKAINGVKGCKVYSAQDMLEEGEKQSAGKVKCVITSYNGVASSELLTEVQQEIDPTKDGTGDGLAPIGHIVTIETVNEEKINISAKFDLKCSWEDISEQISNVITSYLNELITEWDSVDGIIVRRSQIQSQILEVLKDNVIDVEDVKINALSENYRCNKNGIPSLGGVSNG